MNNNIFEPHQMLVKSKDDVEGYIELSQKNRTSGSTNLNLQSSRSHCIYQLNVHACKASDDGDEIFHGVLNMIDLAGSENSKIQNLKGEQFEECKAINSSLTALGQVFQAIQEGQKHIPYRNSILTKVLENHLSKDTKALMMVNVSPLMSNYRETLNSLNFAEKVNQCKLNKGTKKNKIKKDWKML